MKTRIFDSREDEFTNIKTVLYSVIAVILLAITKGSLGYKPTTD